MVKNALTFLTLTVLALLAPLALAQNKPQAAPPVQSFVDRTHITLNDVITLTIKLDVSMGNSRPTFTGLNKDFEQVGGISSRSTYTNSNGAVQAWTEYSIMLRPLNKGTLTIPAFTVDKQTTQPIQITVNDAPANTGSNDEVFLRAKLSKKESYVQEQLIFTAKIYYSIALDQGAKLSQPEIENAVVQQLGTDNNTQEVVNGISYNVVERRFVVFPQQSGTLKIPPMTFTATVGRLGGINRFFSNSRAAVREINLATDAISITVKPQPSTFDGNTWLPANELKLEESWSGDLSNVHVGDAVTRNVTITANGLSSSLLPAITNQDQSGLRFYPDQPVREDTAGADGVIGKRKDGTAIVASQAGDFTVPEVKLAWWNTKSDRMEYATLPARTIKVLAPLNAPDANSVTPGTALSNAGIAAPGSNGAGSGEIGAIGSNPLWISTTVLFAALWLATTFLWLRNRQQLAYVETTTLPPVARMPATAESKATPPAQNISADTALRVVKTACDNRHFADIRKALLKWGQTALGNSELLTLDQLAQACNDEQLTSFLSTLDRALYGNTEAQLDTALLYQRVAALHKQGFKQQSGDKYALPPLYKA